MGEASGNGQMGPPGNGASGDNRTDGQEVKWRRNGSGDWAAREVRKKNIEEDKLLSVGTCVLVFSSRVRKIKKVELGDIRSMRHKAQLVWLSPYISLGIELLSYNILNASGALDHEDVARGSENGANGSGRDS